ncbi:MAG: UPF0147 family protein [Candidatus Thorarchaeota archaeon]
MAEQNKKKELSEETLQKIDQATMILSQIGEDSTVPRNIRRAANEAIEQLHGELGSAAVRASNAISRLGDATLDPNCPSHARTGIWNAVSILETIND